MSLQFSNLAHVGMLTTESPLRDLAAIIRSRTPLIAVESNEEMQIVRLVRQIGHQFQLKTFRWTVTEGMQAFDSYDQPQQVVLKSQEILSYIKTANNCLFVLLDFQPYLQDNVHVRFLKDIALTCSKHYSTVVLVGGTLQVPEDLRPFTAYFRLPLPTPDQLRGIVNDVAGEWGAEHGYREVRTTNKALDLLVHNLAGLTATDARRLALKAINDNGVISESELPEVMRAKYELLGRDSPLSFEYETAQFAEIGGMLRLRQWLEARKSFFRDQEQEPLDPPRGLLLLGVQGCGKSLAAKAAAGIFGVPLLRLDFGVLYNKYYGETERNLRKALETAEVMAPCVLWLDEIEKGLATGEEDGGVSRRVLGALLTWMSERKKNRVCRRHGERHHASAAGNGAQRTLRRGLFCGPACSGKPARNTGNPSAQAALRSRRLRPRGAGRRHGRLLRRGNRTGHRLGDLHRQGAVSRTLPEGFAGRN